MQDSLAKVPSAQKIILVMHHDMQVSSRLAQLFGQQGFLVTVADHPISDAAELRSHQPDLVITDDSYRTLSGEPLPAWVRRTITAPVLAVCASGDVLAGVKMLEMGADDYITPSLGPREVIARVRRLLRCNSSHGATAP